MITTMLCCLNCANEDLQKTVADLNLTSEDLKETGTALCKNCNTWFDYSIVYDIKLNYVHMIRNYKK